MKNRIITISREFGSGGRTIGKKVAEKLGIPCYDAELIHKIAQQSGFSENYIKDAGEYTPGGFLASAFANRSMGPTNEDYLWKIQYHTDIQLKTLSRRIEVFNVKIIMRRESVIFYSENHRFDNAVRRCLSN